ncbi:hypothetical protein ACFV23_32800, partial [Streptomyces sp. NPDC059627]
MAEDVHAQLRCGTTRIAGAVKAVLVLRLAAGGGGSPPPRPPRRGEAPGRAGGGCPPPGVGPGAADTGRLV